jgi:chorismate synthase
LLLGIVEGIPSGLPLAAEAINIDLSRRQRGYGRGGRMRIEKDQVEIVAGVRHGKTLGGPIGLIIQNKDWENWQHVMAVDPGEEEGARQRVVTKPRPGHADLVGAIKYGHEDIRNVLEKASARETAMRVAVGAVAKELLHQFYIEVISHVVEIGGVRSSIVTGTDPEDIFKQAEASEVRCADSDVAQQMIAKIKEAKLKGDTLGGVFEVVVTRPPIGLGSYSQWDRRLNARLAMALMSIQAIKGVEIGLGFEVARRFGSEVHDEIFYNKPKGKDQKSKERTGFYRETNNAGGIEGGVTNGENIVLRAAMKPIATLYTPLKSVDIMTKEPFEATVERSDVCSVPAAGVVGEAVVAFEMAAEMVQKFGGDSLSEMKRNYEAYLENVKNF